MTDYGSIWGTRLKQARLAANLSQKQLGILAGLDPSVASTRINRYELGVHKPDYLIAVRLAEVLKIPTAYLYTEDDVLAELILAYNQLSKAKRKELVGTAQSGATPKPISS